MKPFQEFKTTTKHVGVMGGVSYLHELKLLLIRGSCAITNLVINFPNQNDQNHVDVKNLCIEHGGQSYPFDQHTCINFMKDQLKGVYVVIKSNTSTDEWPLLLSNYTMYYQQLHASTSLREDMKVGKIVFLLQDLQPSK